MNTKIRQLFNRAVTDEGFREQLFSNLHEVLQTQGIEQYLAHEIEARQPQTLQALAEVLQTLED
jgi:hypothetical protein